MTKKELTEKFASIRDVANDTKEYTPEEMTIAYVNGYKNAMDIACELLESVVMYRKSFFGRREKRIFDDDFIRRFREENKIE